MREQIQLWSNLKLWSAGGLEGFGSHEQNTPIYDMIKQTALCSRFEINVILVSSERPSENVEE